VYANVVVDQGTQIYPKFSFTYTTGAMFWTSESKATLQWSAAQVASVLAVSTPTTLTVAVRGRLGFDESGNKYDALASASSPWSNRSASGFYPTVLQQKIITGVDANGSRPDANITFNFQYGWDYGDKVSAKNYDFGSTGMHELFHTMGWTRNISAPGKNTRTNWMTYDQFVTDSSGVKAVDPTTYEFNTSLNPNLTRGDGGLFFDGPNAVAAYGGLVPLYTSTKWKGGSSVSHLDGSVFNGIDLPRDLMNASSAKGIGPRRISAIDLGVLKDLGYTLATVASAPIASVA